MNPFAKFMIIGGAAMIIIGLFWQFGMKFLPLGKLPGDIAIEKENFRFYFPIATCVIASVILTVIMWLIRMFSK